MISEGGHMAKTRPSPNSSPFYRVSESDLTEIQLHTVDSINDLHRMHSDHNHKGNRTSYPPIKSPSTNGNVHMHDQPGVTPASPPTSSKWQSRLQEALQPRSPILCAMGCGIITLLLITALLIYFLVQQGRALHALVEAVREKQAVSMEISLLIQELQALRHNLTSLRGEA